MSSIILPQPLIRQLKKAKHMPRMHELKDLFQNSVLTVAIDTIIKNKQAFLFVNAKRSAEKVAEDITKTLSKKKFEFEKNASHELIELSEKLLQVLPQPTHQCERLAFCVKKGIAFHHSGLHSQQRELIEESFRKGIIRIITCTPTLAMGVELPAFRAIIRDVKRYGAHGMDFIPVIEYMQMIGRAGRPSFDSYGESILIANSESEKQALIEHYINGEPEPILSKLAVEPVLRTYILSLIAVGLFTTKEGLYDFFSKTFWAHQYKDMDRLKKILDKMISLLFEWELVQKQKDLFRATFLGKRVAELYLDPLTAQKLRIGIFRSGNTTSAFVLLQLLCNTLEIRPLLSISAKEYDSLQEKANEHISTFLDIEPSMFDPDYDAWLQSIKTAFVFQEWIEEKTEEFILDNYNMRPGEIRTKLQVLDWLCYALSEIARIEQKQAVLRDIFKLRLRLKYGIKEELLPLVRFKGIGRVRARLLFKNNIKDVKGVKSASIEVLAKIVGEKIAKSMKEQVGEKESNKQKKL
ncbi:hypothetical protein HYV79_03180, partial [Candidatus Woesearchaeota archaeon]|nr:hypothetical protein [Candidatus Woesearchaeota archaeon]